MLNIKDLTFPFSRFSEYSIILFFISLKKFNGLQYG